MKEAMRHLNGHILCAVDCETTGLKAGYHDLIQICVMPLDAELLPLKTFPPFYMTIKPQRPETIDPAAFKVHGIRYGELMKSAEDPFHASELFEEWFNRMSLAFNKKIAPLGHNYSFDAGFIKDWLGEDSYETYFDYHVRDTSAACLFLNDRASFGAEDFPYPKMKLGNIAARLGVDNKFAHDALQDCLMTAEVYRRMIHSTLGVSWTPLSPNADAQSS